MTPDPCPVAQCRRPREDHVQYLDEPATVHCPDCACRRCSARAGTLARFREAVAERPRCLAAFVPDIGYLEGQRVVCSRELGHAGHHSTLSGGALTNVQGEPMEYVLKVVWSHGCSRLGNLARALEVTGT